MTNEDELSIDQLWKLYSENRDLEIKNQILTYYLPMVKKLVRRMMPQYMEYNDIEDLIHCGFMGLIDAVDKFDLSYGVKFETYSSTRIKGEILDYMRKQDWASSSLRKKISRIEYAYEALEAELSRTPDESEIAQRAQMTVDEVKGALYKSHMFNLVYFEDFLTENAISRISGSEKNNPETVAENNEMYVILGQVIEELPEKERLVITLHYYEEMTLKEIAGILKVSESRVSQIHSKVLFKMKNIIKRMTQ